MKKGKKIFGLWFKAWFVLAIISILIMLISPKHAKGAASVIMATFFAMPVRDWLNRLAEWFIWTYVHINSKKGAKIKVWATYYPLTDTDESTPLDNPAFMGTIRFAIGLIIFILTLLALIFQKISLNCVYAVLHTVEFIVRGKIKPLAILINLLLSIGFLIFLWLTIKKFINEEGIIDQNTGKFNLKELWWKLLIVLGVIIVKIILSNLLFKYTLSMMITSLLFWISVIIIIVIIAVVVVLAIDNL